MQLTDNIRLARGSGIFVGSVLGVAALCAASSALASYSAEYHDGTFHVDFNGSETIPGTGYTMWRNSSLSLKDGGERYIMPNDSIFANFGQNITMFAPNSYVLSVAASGTGNVDLLNEGDLTSYAVDDTVIYAEAVSGDVTINNLADGKIVGINGSSAISTSVGTGMTEIINSGRLGGSGMGAVYMESMSGDIQFTNTGMVTGNMGNSAYGIVNAHTSGKVVIDNSYGLIQTETGSRATGILIGADVTGGTVTNVGGVIDVTAAGTAIDVRGRNIDVNLRGSGAITGSVILAGGNRNNRLLLDSNGVNIAGNVTLGGGNTMDMKFLNVNPALPFLSVTGTLNLAGGDLYIDLNGMALEVGESYFLLSAAGGIEGWLSSINGQSVVGDLVGNDFSETFAIGDYNVAFELVNGTNVMMNVVGMIPEPSTYALVAGGMVQASCWVVRRHRLRA